MEGTSEAPQEAVAQRKLRAIASRDVSPHGIIAQVRDLFDQHHPGASRHIADLGKVGEREVPALVKAGWLPLISL